MFFFEKKNQKTFAPLDTRVAIARLPSSKSFLRLFFKKGGLSSSSGRQIAALTSLRLFASLAIVVDHATSRMTGALREIPFYQGVTFFFVLSGFILAYSHPDLRSRGDMRRFWLARFARIWPATIASFGLVIVLVPGVLGMYRGPSGILQLLLGVACLQAWVPLQPYYFVLNPVCWSISDEVFFYVCFPWLNRDLARNWAVKLLLCGGIVLAMMAVVAWLRLPTYAQSPDAVDAGALIYTFPPTRLFDFVLGMTACLVFRRGQRLRAGSTRAATALEAGIVAAVLAQGLLGPSWYEWQSGLRNIFSNGAVLWIERSGHAPLYALLILVFAQERGLLSRLLRARPFVIGGEISFSLYLVHQIWLRWIWSDPAILHGLPHALIWLLYILVILVNSFAMWRLVEVPCRRLITGRRRGLVPGVS
jgi:peptidoglycan/LPS O-acetylase OafA/YrhL